MKKRLLLMNRSKELETRSYFHFRSVCLNDGADNCDVNVLRTDVVRRGDHGNVNV